MALRLQCITIDAQDPLALAQFWAEALGWKIGEDVNEIEVWIEREPGDPKTMLLFGDAKASLTKVVSALKAL